MKLVLLFQQDGIRFLQQVLNYVWLTYSSANKFKAYQFSENIVCELRGSATTNKHSSLHIFHQLWLPLC